MTQEEFRSFYESTAKQLWAYLARVSGDPTWADDLSQEAYLRLLRSSLPADADIAHRRNYLYRIATNLLRDRQRLFRKEQNTVITSPVTTPRSEALHDVHSALRQLRPADRELLWLAYVEGASHQEIAAMTGYTRLSIRPLLSRARARMAAILKGERK